MCPHQPSNLVKLFSRPHTTKNPKWWFSNGKSRKFQGNLGWWNIRIWPDQMMFLGHFYFWTSSEKIFVCTVSGTRMHPTYQTNRLVATWSKLLQGRLNAKQTKNASVNRDLLHLLILLGLLLGARTSIHFWLVVVPVIPTWTYHNSSNMIRPCGWGHSILSTI